MAFFNFGNKKNPSKPSIPETTPDDDDNYYEEISGINGAQSPIYEVDQQGFLDPDDDDGGFLSDDDSQNLNSSFVPPERNQPLDPQSYGNTYISNPHIHAPTIHQNSETSVESAREAYELIAGIDDIPRMYKDEKLLPELTGISIQFNNFRGVGELAEWQIRGRSLIRKYQMANPDNPMTGRQVAGLEYVNSLLLWRARDGFERMQSNGNLSAAIQEGYGEASPSYEQPKKKGFLASLFGGN